ncbi:MAG TPA: hypothetical protein VMJ32_16080 [Pirellulales bacterium]|nr:hypothetical protein [Pirellulales bacterium]
MSNAEIAPPVSTPTILDRWEITAEQLTKAMDENPSCRGMLFGYIAEYKLREMWFTKRKGVTGEVVKDDDHDRENKGDLVVTYKGRPFRIESKSLQTNSVIQTAAGTYFGKAQCDASDRRRVKFPDGSTLETTCLLRGEFDILAINIYAFQNKWKFVFCKNQDLPKNTYRKYTAAQQKYLLPSLIPTFWPPQPPFRNEPFSLMEEMLKKPKNASKSVSFQPVSSRKPKSKSDSSGRAPA